LLPAIVQDLTDHPNLTAVPVLYHAVFVPFTLQLLPELVNLPPKRGHFIGGGDDQVKP